jgi:hypothetical protein
MLNAIFRLFRMILLVLACPWRIVHFWRVLHFAILSPCSVMRGLAALSIHSIANIAGLLGPGVGAPWC